MFMSYRGRCGGAPSVAARGTAARLRAPPRTWSPRPGAPRRPAGEVDPRGPGRRPAPDRGAPPGPPTPEPSSSPPTRPRPAPTPALARHHRRGPHRGPLRRQRRLQHRGLQPHRPTIGSGRAHIPRGVDVPAWPWVFYATSTSTLPLFAQAVGASCARGQGDRLGVLPGHAAGLVAETGPRPRPEPPHWRRRRTPCSPEDRLLAEANKTENARPICCRLRGHGQPGRVRPGALRRRRVRHRRHGGQHRGAEYWGCPALLEPEQVTALLRQRQDKQIASQKKQAAAEARAQELRRRRRPAAGSGP